MSQPSLTPRQRAARMLFLPLFGLIGIALSLMAGDTLALVVACVSFAFGVAVVVLVALPSKDAR